MKRNPEDLNRNVCMTYIYAREKWLLSTKPMVDIHNPFGLAVGRKLIAIDFAVNNYTG